MASRIMRTTVANVTPITRLPEFGPINYSGKRLDFLGFCAQRALLCANALPITRPIPLKELLVRRPSGYSVCLATDGKRRTPGGGDTGSNCAVGRRFL